MSIIEFPSNGLTLVSLFAGAGGSSLGYKMAGYDVRLAVDWDPNAAATYQANFPETPFWEGDIAGLSGAEALWLAGLTPGELDVLDGSPPCQGFSTAGKRIFLDRRNRLFEEYVRLLEEFRPKIFIMENVSGLIRGKMRLVFAEMTAALKGAGYHVSCRLLNAWWYGVPQDRRRLVWVGTQEGLGVEPSHPQPMYVVPITVRQAWEHIEDNDILHKVAKWPYPSSKTALALASTLPGKVLRGFSVARRLSFDRPAWTIATGGYVAGYPGSTWFSHPLEGRGITLREAARIQGFPDWFQFPKDLRTGAMLIGNSVPPPMAEAVGCHVARLLDARPRR